MGKVVIGITMSLDGYIQDRNGSMSELNSDSEAMLHNKPLQELIQSTDAVIMGRNSFGLVDDPDTYADFYSFQCPIFVLTHHPPQKRPKGNDRLTFTFVTDGIESAVRQAKQAAGAKDVTVIGAPNTSHQVLQAGLADELYLDIVPILLGGGLRFFEDIGLDPIRLERIKTVEMPGGRIHLRFRIVPAR